MIRVFAPAKINLALHVTGQRADGYHLLDMLVGFADIGDWLEVSPATSAAPRLHVGGPEAAGLLLAGGENIITRTLAAFDAPAFDLRLTKNLPLASGMGGGSSNAAAAYRAYRHFVPGLAAAGDAARLLALGADVPMCAAPMPARVQGVGEQITPRPDLAALPIVLVNPRRPLATPAVFAALKRKAHAPLAPLPASLAQPADLIAYLAAQRNDLQAPALRLAPEIASVLAALAATHAALVRMSGSGATCFGLYADTDQANTAAQNLRAAHPAWWVQAGALNGPLPKLQEIRATT